jgi:anti-sigma B factor antagonist
MIWTQLAERRHDDVVILDLLGNIAVGESDEPLVAKIVQLLDQRWLKILLNLADIPYIDSWGLAEVVKCFTEAQKRGGSLKLCSAHRRILKLLKVTRLSDVLVSFDSEEEALQSFRSVEPGVRKA